MAAGGRRQRGWQPCTRYVGPALLLRAPPTFPDTPPASARHGFPLVTLQAAKLLYESRDQ